MISHPGSDVMASEFVYTGLPARVVFGAGAVGRLSQEIERLGSSRALIVCTPTRRVDGERLMARIGGRCIGVHAHAVMHTPIETAETGAAAVGQLSADCLVAVGGGSAVGLAKAIALRTGTPVLAVPTTYSGSEMTPLQGITEGGIKRGHRDLRMLPKTVIYDPELTFSLPRQLSITSAVNGIAHAAEGLYGREANPLMSLIAEQGIRAFVEGLPRVVADPGDLPGRTRCLQGAWYCGMVLGAVGTALHHKLCHVLGGSFDLPHSETHTIVLPHALAYNREAAPKAMETIAAALGTTDASQGVYDFIVRLGGPIALKDIGMRESDLDRAATLATDAPYWNPRSADQASIRQLLEDAYHGRRPD